jgi:hypothetical protein
MCGIIIVVIVIIIVMALVFTNMPTKSGYLPLGYYEPIVGPVIDPIWPYNVDVVNVDYGYPYSYGYYGGGGGGGRFRGGHGGGHGGHH